MWREGEGGVACKPQGRKVLAAMWIEQSCMLKAVAGRSNCDKVSGGAHFRTILENNC
jgi:hypothetical protein